MSDVCTAYWFLFAVSKWNMQQVAYYRVINWSENTLPRFLCTQLLQLRVPQDVSLLTIKENQLGLSEKGETLLKHRKLTVHSKKLKKNNNPQTYMRNHIISYNSEFLLVTYYKWKEFIYLNKRIALLTRK